MVAGGSGEWERREGLSFWEATSLRMELRGDGRSRESEWDCEEDDDETHSGI